MKPNANRVKGLKSLFFQPPFGVLFRYRKHRAIMGFFSTTQTTLPTAAENKTAARRFRSSRSNRRAAKNRIGTHSRTPILSTKYLDEETGLYYYGYRYLSTVLGKWMSKDPKGEQGGSNLYGFVGNCSIIYFDSLGLSFSHSHDCSPEQIAILRTAEQEARTAILDLETKLVSFNTGLRLARSTGDQSWLSPLYSFAPIINPLSDVSQQEVLAALSHMEQTASSTFSFLSVGQYGVECECSCDKSEGQDVEAYVYKNLVRMGLDDDIHFCPAYFINVASRTKTYLHEASHWPFGANTDDLLVPISQPQLMYRDAYSVPSLALNRMSFLKAVLQNNWRARP